MRTLTTVHRSWQRGCPRKGNTWRRRQNHKTRLFLGLQLALNATATELTDLLSATPAANRPAGVSFWQGEFALSHQRV
jgi:hypothetical protein